ncbi:hypothetical protein AYL99_09922 [Fonsecaea erecta]|uniref:Aminoglycoside phosphotransferase domain-containing protein n=1 Tax=Fonsecaea erecta TaxID=1367422 RepID=A0A178Z7L2_9EURO|nr:hypothetical protein AYL99_09922 [Fonsecaea erecta]OAP55770.1 hypothetical protein AYL99_09922 [Fonsecaea erecta]
MPASEQLRSLLFRARLWLGTKRFGLLGPSSVRVSSNRIIKGPCEPVELEALKYVRQHTSIPVSKVHRTHRLDGRLYIEMEYIHGDTLRDLWYGDSLSAGERQAILQELAGYIEQLRKLDPPAKWAVASSDLGPSLDYRVGYRLFGPFDSNGEFHSFLRGNIPLENCTQVFGDVVTRCHARQYRTCFSHADLCPRNLIVRNGKIAAVIDWQFAGWYPEYWEYTKAHYSFPNVDWWDRFEQAVTRYDDELAAERALWRQLDEPGMLFT